MSVQRLLPHLNVECMPLESSLLHLFVVVVAALGGEAEVEVEDVLAVLLVRLDQEPRHRPRYLSHNEPMGGGYIMSIL